MRHDERQYGHDPDENQYEYNKRQNRRVEPRRKKKSLVSRFFRIVFFTLGTFVILFAAVIFGYSKLFGEGNISETLARVIDSNLSRGSLTELFSGIPKRTNFAVLGVDDDGTRTDLIMVASLNTATGALDIISIPRDTYTVIPEERRVILREKDLYCPSDGVTKINAVHHYAGKELGVEFIVKQLEELLGITITYYIKVDLEAFRQVVDQIGGVEFDVPQRMYYNDPIQGLYIDLQPGIQILNGKQAEGLVRYRKSDENNPVSKGYAQGDIGRVSVQQDFFKAMIIQILSKENIMGNAVSMFTIATQYVRTNFMAADIAKYASSFTKISVDNIKTHTLPNTPTYINGVSYVITDEDEIKEFIEEILDENTKSE